MNLWQPLERFFERLDELRRFIDIATAYQTTSGMHWKGSLREARASAIVCSIAELESLITDSLVQVNEVINTSKTAIKDLKPPLRSIAVNAQFDSLGHLKDPERLWETRSYLMSLHICDNIAVLPTASRIQRKRPHPPLDGKTLKPTHFKRIAEIYSINPADLVGASHTLVLSKFSDARNDIAHANIPFSSMFSRKSFLISDIRTDLNIIDEIGFNFVDRFDSYIKNLEFLERPSKTI